MAFDPHLIDISSSKSVAASTMASHAWLAHGEIERRPGPVSHTRAVIRTRAQALGHAHPTDPPSHTRAVTRTRAQARGHAHPTDPPTYHPEKDALYFDVPAPLWPDIERRLDEAEVTATTLANDQKSSGPYLHYVYHGRPRRFQLDVDASPIDLVEVARTCQVAARLARGFE